MANVKIPYIVLQDESGINIATNLENNDIYITHLRYSSDDDDEDKCVIKLSAKSVEGINISGIFIYDLPLRISWGYIGEMGSPIMVYIRDIKTHYGSDSLDLELNCTDLSSYLKSFKTQGSGKVSVLEYLKLFVEDKYRATIQHNGKVIWRSYSKLLPGQYPGINNEATYSQGLSYTKTSPLDNLKPTFGEPPVVDPEPIGYMDNTDPNTKLGIFLNTPIDIISANISPFQVLRNIFRQAPDGPWFISGGGNNLQIHNRDLRSSPLLSYTYHSDRDFLDFTITSKREAADANILNYTTLDPGSRIVKSRESYIQSLKGLKPLSSVIPDKSITQQQKEEHVKKLMESYLGYLNYGVEVNTIFSKDVLNQDWSNSPKDKGYKGKYIPKNAAPSDQVYAIMNNLSIAGYIYSTPLDIPDSELDTMSNVAKQIEMERMEADLRVEGNTYLNKNCIVNLTGLLPEHNGNWYVKKCDHEIGYSGYIINAELFLVNDNNSQSVIRTETQIGNEQEDDLENRYMLEQKLFKELESIKILTGITEGTYVLPGVLNSDYAHYKNIADAVKSGGIDINQDIPKLLKAINKGNNVWGSNSEE